VYRGRAGARRPAAPKGTVRLESACAKHVVLYPCLKPFGRTLRSTSCSWDHTSLGIGCLASRFEFRRSASFPPKKAKHPMIVWLASYPRSGNTFVRILLHQLYGVPTYTGFMAGDDLDYDVNAGHITGHTPLPSYVLDAIPGGPDALITKAEDTLKPALDRLEREEQIYFIKTHCTAKELFDSPYRALLIVRDVRDAVVSMAWYILRVQNSRERLLRSVPHVLRNMWKPSVLFTFIKRCVLVTSSLLAKFLGLEDKLFGFVARKLIYDARWSHLNLGWIDRPQGVTSIIKFEDLVARPVDVLNNALGEIDLRLRNGADAKVPTFEQLRKVHPSFFRQGKTGEWKQQLRPEFIKLLHDIHGEALIRFGYEI